MTNGSLLSEKPASKYELVINLKTAKALGLDVPLLQRHSAGLGAAYFLTRAAFPLALAVGSSGDRTILPAGLSRVTLLSPILWAS